MIDYDSLDHINPQASLNNAQSHFLLAETPRKAGRYAKAEEHYRKVYEIDQANVIYRYELLTRQQSKPGSSFEGSRQSELKSRAFAVELLFAGVPIDRVSVLLGHRSVRMTEKHYLPWVKARQEQLTASIQRAWFPEVTLKAD